MMIIIFWDMTPCGSYKNRPKMEAIRSSETSVLIRATRCHLPEDDNHRIVVSFLLCLMKITQLRKLYSIEWENDLWHYVNT
jgi:hypothetical protein